MADTHLRDMRAATPPTKSGFEGLGTAGGAALGLGGGLVGGMLLEDAIQGHDQNEYNQGYGKNIPYRVLCLRTNMK